MNNLILIQFICRGFKYKKFDRSTNTTVELQGIEYVRCRLWFDSVDELNKFLEIHCPIKADFSKCSRVKETRWIDFTTIPKD